MNMQTALNNIFASTSVWHTQYNGLHVSSHWAPRTRSEMQAAERLEKRGLIEYAPYPNITPAGWAKLGTSPVEILLAETRAEIAVQVELAQDDDRLPCTPWRLDMLRDLYGEPDMPVARAEAIERQRVFDNAQLSEARIQELEHNLALYELKYTQEA